MNLSAEEGCVVACTKKSFRSLQQCVGAWEINPEIIGKVGDRSAKHGVCDSHFHLDQKPKFHSPGLKKCTPLTSSQIKQRKCLFCSKMYHVSLRGKKCEEHSRKILGKNLFTCVCQFTCSSITNQIDLLSEKDEDNINSNYRSRYICQSCFQKNGGHI